MLDAVDGVTYAGGETYYVQNGYLHPYSSAKMCEYNLVDTETLESVEVGEFKNCLSAYTECAQMRSSYESYEGQYLCVNTY
jgi:hypothetical protein